jgi:hypothetical protein
MTRNGLQGQLGAFVTDRVTGGRPAAPHARGRRVTLRLGRRDRHELGDRNLTARAGDSIWVPRHTNHAFKTTAVSAHSEDVLIRMNNDCWSSSTENAWATLAPPR